MRLREIAASPLSIAARARINVQRGLGVLHARMMPTTAMVVAMPCARQRLAYTANSRSRCQTQQASSRITHHPDQFGRGDAFDSPDRSNSQRKTNGQQTCYMGDRFTGHSWLLSHVNSGDIIWLPIVNTTLRLESPQPRHAARAIHKHIQRITGHNSR